VGTPGTEALLRSAFKEIVPTSEFSDGLLSSIAGYMEAKFDAESRLCRAYEKAMPLDGYPHMIEK
jgi:hypothetical protein